MQQYQQELMRIKAQAQNMAQMYGNADEETRQKYAASTREKISRMYEIKNAIMQMPDQAGAKELVNLFVDTMGALKEIPDVESSPVRTERSAMVTQSAAQAENDLCFQPPRVSVKSARNLNDNVKSLREQLQNIHKLLNQTNDATEVTYEEMQDKIASQDISAMAVQQLKATVTMQNRQLSQEVTHLRTQVDELNSTCSELKQALADASHTAENATALADERKIQFDQLMQDYKIIKRENEVLYEEKQKYQSKYDSLVKQQQLEAERNRSDRESKYNEIINLQTENQALVEANKKMRDRITELEQCDVESASMEVSRAAKTVEALNKVIEDLKRKLVEQRQNHVETVASLRTTIAAMQEELFGDEVDDSDRIPRSELEKKIVELTEQNEALNGQLREMGDQVKRFSEVKQQVSQSINPLYANPESMLGSMSLYARPQGVPREVKKDDGDLEALIKMSRQAGK
ncbi:Conserved_hypothetical protein [Hexamita inflata]|uniref:Uncharacterized protein n=1 Tax=Hexamita inflata TaxID=28002 RepID=A0ABP1GS76_9EUKA